MNRLKELRMQSGYTQEMLGGYLGVQKAAICKYETGRANIPQELLTKLSDLFSVSIDFLLGHSDLLPPVSSDAYVPVPVVGSVHAGTPILAFENISDQIPVLKQDVRGGDYFFMEVVGDCMTDAHILEGSLILVRLQSRVENGEIAVVRIEDEVVLRRVKWLKNQLILYPANAAYEPMVIASGDVQVIGRVVEVRIRGL